MWPNPQETADLVTFTKEILNGKIHFLCNEINPSLVTFLLVMALTVNFKLDLDFTYFACFVRKSCIWCFAIFTWVCIELLVCYYQSLRHFFMIFCNMAHRGSMLAIKILTSTKEIASYSEKLRWYKYMGYFVIGPSSKYICGIDASMG